MELDAKRAEVVVQIREVTAALGRVPTRKEFARMSGVKQTSWRGILFRGWGEAVAAAGLERGPRKKSDAELLEQYGVLALESGRLPTAPDLRMSAREGKKSSTWVTYHERFGGRKGLNARLMEHWADRAEGEKIRELCGKPIARWRERVEPVESGWVYLMVSAGRYKIGRAADVESRWRELVGAVPHELRIVHRIKTTDMWGIELYWHRRFGHKRVKGEWFALNEEDVKLMKGLVVM